MWKKSKYELAIIENSIQIRTNRNKPQSYLAMILDVSDGYIGHVENPNRPEMYTHDQINAIALDFGISPHLFYPKDAINQPLTKKNSQNEQERTSRIKQGVEQLTNSNFFDTKKSTKDIIEKLKEEEFYLVLNLTNKDITDILRPIVKLKSLQCTKVGTKNFYFKL